MLSDIVHGGVTIDALVFNEYEQTRIDFFDSATVNPYADVFRTVINGWFRAFSAFTQIILLIVLVAMGVMTMLKAGSQDNKKTFKMLEGWIIALALLFFAPYAMKYAIELNDAIVKELRNNSVYSTYSVFNIDFKKDFAAEIAAYNEMVRKHNATADPSNKMYELKWQVGEDSFSVALEAFLNWVSENLEERIEKLERTREITAQLIAKARRGEELEGNSNVIIETGNSAIVNPRPLPSQLFTVAQILDVNGIPRQPEVALDCIEALITGEQKMSAGNAYRTIVNDVRISRGGLILLMSGGKTTQEQDIGLSEKEADAAVRRSKNKLNIYMKRYANMQEELQMLERKLAIIEEVKGHTKKLDLMGILRTKAGRTYRLLYVIIWFMLIYQLVALTFRYFKRLIYTSVLIAIYPLVIAFYGIERTMGIDKPKAFSTWIGEFMVNIFIQSVHAILYLILVETGLSIFEADQDNWLVFFVAVYAIFPMEALLKSLLGLKGSTVKDLKASAGTLATVAAATSILGAGGGRGKGKAYTANAQNKNKKTDEKVNKANSRTNARESARQLMYKRLAQAGINPDKYMNKIAESERRAIAKNSNRMRKAESKKKKRLKRAKTMARVQRLRNINAKMSAITTGLAMGGEPDDFVAGAAIASVAAGSTTVKKKPQKQPDNNTSTNKSGASHANRPGGNRYANSNPASYGGNANTQAAGATQNSANNASTNNQQNATNSSNTQANTQTNNNGNTAANTTTNTPMPSRLQGAFRSRLTDTTVDVNSSDPTYRVISNENES